MKKFLLAGLILASMTAYGAAGEVTAKVEAVAIVLSDIKHENNYAIDAGGTLYFGQLFQGDTKNTWTAGNGAFPAKPTLIGEGTTATTTTNGKSVTAINMDGAEIEYELPETVTLTGPGLPMTATLYDGSTDTNDQDAQTTPITANYKKTVNMGAGTSPDGKYELRIHGEVTAAATQVVGKYDGTFDLIARYTSGNAWY